MSESSAAPTDPVTELAGYRAQRSAGTMDQDTYLSHVERLGPLASQGVTPAPDAAQARVRVDELRTLRIEGKITQEEYFARFEQLGAQANPSTDVVYQNPDGTKTTMSAADAAALDATFAPPASPAHYDMPGDGSPEADEWNRNAGETLHAVGVPAAIVSYGNDIIAGLAKQFANADPVTVQAHVDSVSAQLRERWGDSFKTRIDRIDELVTQTPGALGDLLSEKPWLLADPLLLMKLDSLAEHRARKRV